MPVIDEFLLMVFEAEHVSLLHHSLRQRLLPYFSYVCLLQVSGPHGHVRLCQAVFTLQCCQADLGSSTMHELCDCTLAWNSRGLSFFICRIGVIVIVLLYWVVGRTE